MSAFNPVPSVPATPEPLGQARPAAQSHPAVRATGLEVVGVGAWFGNHHVLSGLNLEMRARQVTALIGPSGCGKSTFLRILNRMHELVPGAAMTGEVRLDGVDIYGADRRSTETRRQIGMVFQKPNPFPAMSIKDNVLSGLRLSGIRTRSANAIVEECLLKAGLWNEVRNRLGAPGGSLSGGQQQRLCIARALAVKPRVLLMDEPCSALDPASTARIEKTISEIAREVTVVIVTHNMQQARRVSDTCAFFMIDEGSPGMIVEVGPTEKIFTDPDDARTAAYVGGRFG
jgi:phosphate transport system ATP-binding protein